tara:strand:- start:665 stop:1060 length:396 start_codon:yes stop_codon:yes gene_type:complete
MNTKRINISLIIRRFFAVFIFFSIGFGIVDDFVSGDFSGESVNGALVGLVIVYFLSRSPRNTQIDSIEESSTGNLEEDADIYDEETLKEFEKFESDNKDLTDVIKGNNSYNPVRDNESLFVRLFKGRSDRI